MHCGQRRQMSIQSVVFFSRKRLSLSLHKRSYLIEPVTKWLAELLKVVLHGRLQQQLSVWAFNSGNDQFSLSEEKSIILDSCIVLITSSMITLILSSFCKHWCNYPPYLVEEILPGDGFSLMKINISHTYLSDCLVLISI